MYRGKHKKTKPIFLLTTALLLTTPREVLSMDQEEILEEGKNVTIIKVTQKANSVVVPDEDHQNKNINQKIALGVVGFLGASVTFTLEVLGATGAFWGATDVFHLRNESNDYQFRAMAMGIGALALVRYVAVHALSQHKQRNYLRDIDQVTGLEKIYKAFESPIPALKTSIVSIAYKLRHGGEVVSPSSNQEEVEEDLLLKCKYENCQDTTLSGPSSNMRRKNLVGQKGTIECSLVPQVDDSKKE
ncbi:MAG: hypothetical protein ACP5OE_09860 [Thermodesulfobium sp.]